MATSPPAGGQRWRPHIRRRTVVYTLVALLLLVILEPVVAQWLDLANIDLFGDVETNPRAAYLAVLVLVWGDAVLPVLPGETTVTSAAVLAAGGALDLWWVCVAASLGAIIGDSSVYWIARSAHGRVRTRMEATAANPRARTVLSVFEDRAPLLIVVGRYVPGFRLVVNFTMGGVVRMPYPRFLRWSGLSGVLWGFYTGILAYLVATVFEGQPLLSLIISGLVTSAAITWVMVVLRRDYLRSRAAAAAD